jgi:hypothetical protein
MMNKMSYKKRNIISACVLILFCITAVATTDTDSDSSSANEQEESTSSEESRFPKFVSEVKPTHINGVYEATQLTGAAVNNYKVVFITWDKLYEFREKIELDYDRYEDNYDGLLYAVGDVTAVQGDSPEKDNGIGVWRITNQEQTLVGLDFTENVEGTKIEVDWTNDGFEYDIFLYKNDGEVGMALSFGGSGFELEYEGSVESFWDNIPDSSG